MLQSGLRTRNLVSLLLTGIVCLLLMGIAVYGHSVTVNVVGPDGTTPTSETVGLYYRVAGSTSWTSIGTSNPSSISLDGTYDFHAVLTSAAGTAIPDSSWANRTTATQSSVAVDADMTITFQTSRVEIEVLKHDASPFQGLPVRMRRDASMGWELFAYTDKDGLASLEVFPSQNREYHVVCASEGSGYTGATISSKSIVDSPNSSGVTLELKYQTSLTTFEVLDCSGDRVSDVNIYWRNWAVASDGWRKIGVTDGSGNITRELFVGSTFDCHAQTDLDYLTQTLDNFHVAGSPAAAATFQMKRLVVNFSGSSMQWQSPRRGWQTVSSPFILDTFPRQIRLKLNGQETSVTVGVGGSCEVQRCFTEIRLLNAAAGAYAKVGGSSTKLYDGDWIDNACGSTVSAYGYVPWGSGYIYGTQVTGFVVDGVQDLEIPFCDVEVVLDNAGPTAYARVNGGPKVSGGTVLNFPKGAVLSAYGYVPWGSSYIHGTQVTGFVVDCSVGQQLSIPYCDVEVVLDNAGPTAYARVNGGPTVSGGTILNFPKGAVLSAYGYVPWGSGFIYGTQVTGFVVDCSVGQQLSIPYCDMSISLPCSPGGAYCRINGLATRYYQGDAVNLPVGASISAYAYSPDGTKYSSQTPHTVGTGCPALSISYCGWYDVIAPEAVCKDATVSLDGTGNGTLSAMDVDGGSSDCCGITARTISQSSFNCDDVGDPLVTLTVYDAAGNSDSCVATVHVVDEIKPVITLNDSALMTLECGVGTYTEPGAQATDNCCVDIGDLVITGSGDVDTDTVGTYYVTYDIEDCHGNAAVQVTRTVNVVDTRSPTITGCPGNIEVPNDTGDCGAVVTWTEPQASDECCLDTFTRTHAPGDDFPVGTTTVTYTAKDCEGHTTTCSFDVKVNDTEKPVPNCPANIEVANDVGICGAEVTFAAAPTDNCGVASVVYEVGAIEISSPYVFPVGTTTVDVAVRDIHSNEATCSFNVTVNDTEKPVISSCPGDIIQNNDPGVCSAVVTWTEPTADDNCGIQSFTSDHSPGETFSVGTTHVTYTALDIHGNSITCEFDVIVLDVEAPTTVFVTTPPDPDNDPTPYFEWIGVDNNACTAPANLEYSTNLDGVGWSGWSSATSATLGPLAQGTHTFQVRAKDEAGNVESTATYTWFIDLTPPRVAIFVPEDQAEYLLNSVVLADWTAVDDETALLSVAATEPVGAPIHTSSPGEQTFIVTAHDQAGNAITVSATYRVVYSVEPGSGAAGGGGAVGQFNTFLDQSIAGGGGEVGDVPLEAVYVQGQPIIISFLLTDDDGNPITDAVASMTLVKIARVLSDNSIARVLSDSFMNQEIISFKLIPYDAEAGVYTLTVQTIQEDRVLAPGYYDIWLGFDDGTQIQLRIEIIGS